MLYIRLENHFPVEATQTAPKDVKPNEWAFGPNGEPRPNGWLNRNDIKSWAFCHTLAQMLSMYSKDGTRYLPTQNQSGTEFDVIVAPKVGDEVSRGFNGDYYPCGKITKITPTWQITTDTGAKFRRVKESAAWKETRGSFWMVNGVHDERCREI